MTETSSLYFGDTTFCDDIRFEVGNKSSFIGIYNGVMFFPETVPFPIAVPKFCMNVRVFLPSDIKADQIELAVYFPGDKEDAPSFKQTIDLPPRQKAVEDMNMSEARAVFGAPLIFSPMQLLSVGAIKVRANINGEIIRLGSLFIRTQPIATPAA